MIKIKDKIFNENKINQIYINEMNNLEIDIDEHFPIVIKDANFSDIEWNYENNNEYCNVFYEDRIKELEEENKTLKELNVCVGCDNNIDYKSRIDKAIEYIEKNKQIGMFADLRKDGTLQYTIECDADDLLKILKGEE